MQKASLESRIGPKEWAFLQALPQKIVYSVREDAVPIAGSRETAYRRLAAFSETGIVELRRGRFSINQGVARQPYGFVERLLPSLYALKNARRFGRAYNKSDIRFVKKHLPENSFVTLDFMVWEMTGFQEPVDFYAYTDVDRFADFLKRSGFSEGTRGHIVLLPNEHVENKIERAYYDSISKGGRGVLDAIALELSYPDKIRHKGQFPAEYVVKVQEDMPGGLVETAG